MILAGNAGKSEVALRMGSVLVGIEPTTFGVKELISAYQNT